MVASLDPEAFPHDALQAGLVKQIVGQFFIGEHGEGGALGAGSEFGGLFYGKAGILADDGTYHAHHDLKAAEAAGFIFFFADSLGWKRPILMLVC